MLIQQLPCPEELPISRSRKLTEEFNMAQPGWPNGAELLSHASLEVMKCSTGVLESRF